MKSPHLYGADGSSPEESKELLALLGPQITIILRSPKKEPDSVNPPFVQREAMIDTGASSVCIDLRTARMLNLDATDNVPLKTAGGAIDATVFAGELEVPELGFKRIMPLYAPRVGSSATPILLGRSFLKHFTMTYEGASGLFYFFDPHIRPPAPPDDE